MHLALGTLIAATFSGPSWAITRSELLMLPVSGETPEFSVADPATALKLQFGTEYDFQITWTGLPGTFFNNGTDAVAEVEPFDMSFSFLAPPPSASSQKTYKLVLVVTSLRSAPATPPGPGLPPRIPAGFVPGSFLGPGGTPPLTPLFVSDDGSGQINPEEGDLFLAIEFSQDLNVPQNGSFEIGFVGPLPGNSFDLLNSAFLVEQSVPEPASALLMLLALGALLLAPARRIRSY